MKHLVRKNKLIKVILLIAASSSTVMAAEQAHIQLSMKAEKEIVTVDDNGKKITKRINVAVIDNQDDGATKQIEAAVTPGDEVIYTIHYINTSRDNATKVVISNPIPAHMVYENGSAQGEDSTIEFSVDGQHFADPESLQVTTPDGITRKAQPEDYRNVRWTLTKPLAAGKEGEVSYRAILR